jgi:hypothetical protein
MTDERFRPNRVGSGAFVMKRRMTARDLGQIVLGTFIVVGTGFVYRAFFDRWEGDARGPLVAAGMAGVTYFILILFTLSWVERRDNSNRQKPND